MLQYYTLEEAAKILGIGPDRAKKLLDDHKVRQYRDGRGGVRYVASAVDELARTLGRGSDPELPLGEAPRPKAGGTPRPSKVAKAEEEDDSTFDFDLPLDDSADVGIGAEKLGQGSSASKRSPRPKPAGSKSPSPKSPAPKAGSDSDVRLVTEGSDLEFQINADSDVKMVDEADPASSKTGASGRSPKPAAPKSEKRHDSEVRIVPLDIPSDSDVKISDDEEGSIVLDRPPGKKHSDSDIRLEEVSRPAPRADEGSDDALVTEEIDLDAEQRRAAEKAKTKGSKSRMKRADAKPPLPTESPFELSDADLDAPPAEGKKKPDSSSDFELTPAAELSDSSIELSASEMAAAPPKQDDSSDEEVALGEISGSGAGNSGINLDAPMDSGISLEGGEGSGDEMEFELSLDSGSTPKPGGKSGKSKVSKVEQAEDSDSEFELTLDSDSSIEQPAVQAGAGAAAEDSDSEFELTLDDSGGLVPMEEQAAAAGEQSDEGDIFETDFEVPALDEESGSEAVALDESDTDLESSDFDLALEEGDAASDEESGSQVVALEDEEAVDEAAETVQRPKKKAAKKKKPAADEESGDEDLGEMLEAGDEEPLEELADVEDDEAVGGEEEEAEAPARAPAVAAAPAPWGPVPALVLLPCVVVMLLAGLMGYELINNMLGYQQPGKVSGLLSEAVAKTFDLELPKE
jgi:excisionase family DNA binding protein